MVERVKVVKDKRPKYKRPFRIVHKDRSSYVRDADGRVVATGPAEMCERVLKEGPLWSRE